VKNVLLVNAPLTILFLSDTHGGRLHDKRIADATPYPLPVGSQLLQDLGFLAFTLPQVEILMPTKKPRGTELPLAEQLANEALHQRRLRICGSSMSIAVSSVAASSKTGSACGRRVSAIWSWNSVAPCITSGCA
jgi:hypothetical protein